MLFWHPFYTLHITVYMSHISMLSGSHIGCHSSRTPWRKKLSLFLTSGLQSLFQFRIHLVLIFNLHFTMLYERVSWKLLPNSCVVRKCTKESCEVLFWSYPYTYCWREFRFLDFLHWARGREWGYPPEEVLGESWLCEVWGPRCSCSHCSGPRTANRSPGSIRTFFRQVCWAAAESSGKISTGNPVGFGDGQGGSF